MTATDPATFVAPFTLFVTGDDPTAETLPVVRDRLRGLLNFLRHGARGAPQFVSQLSQDLVSGTTHGDEKLRRGFQELFREWNGLGQSTPIVLLTDLAPGLGREAARLIWSEFARTNIRVRCLAPEELGTYLKSSVFPDAAAQAEFCRDLQTLLGVSETSPSPEALVFAAQADPTQSVAPVDLQRHNEGDQTCAHCQPPSRPDDVHEDRMKLLNTLAMTAHLMVAFGDFSTLIRQRAFRTRLDGPMPRELPWVSDLPMPHGGPVLNWNPAAGSSEVSARLLHPRYLTESDSDFATALGTQTSSLALQYSRFRVLTEVANNLHRFHLNLEQVPPDTRQVLHAPCEVTIDLVKPGRPPRWSVEDILDALRKKGLRARKVSDQAILATGPDAARVAQSLALGEKTERPVELQHVARIVAHDPLDAVPAIIKRRLDDIEQLYQRLEAIGGKNRNSVLRTLRTLFVLGLVSAAGLDFFSHYVPHSTSSHAVTAATPGNHPAVDPHASDGGRSAVADSHSPHSAATHESPQGASEPSFSTVQLTAGSLSLVLAAVAFTLFMIARHQRWEEQDHDLRAIAEGLRVQYYWNLAGLGKSVSANYMSRHRSELDWIRGVIRSTSAPYDQWRKMFSNLGPPSQLLILKSILWNWLHSQRMFFEKKYRKFEHERHLWHQMAGIAILAGLLTFLRLIATALWPSLESSTGTAFTKRELVELMIAIAGLLIVLVIRPESHHKTQDAHSGHSTQNWICRVCAAMNPVRIGLFLTEVLVPVPGEDSTFWSPSVRRFRVLWKFLAHLPAAIALAVALGWICHAWHGQVPHAPTVAHLQILAGGLCLLGGAVSLAWAEKNLISELAYQYNTMALLYRASSLRMSDELKQLEGFLDENQKLKPAHTVDWDAGVTRIQRLLVELGLEALDENAEWLLLHRSRPMEPLIA